MTRREDDGVVPKTTLHLNQGEGLQRVRVPVNQLGTWREKRCPEECLTSLWPEETLITQAWESTLKSSRNPNGSGFKTEQICSALGSLSDLCLYYRDQPTLGNQSSIWGIFQRFLSFIQIHLHKSPCREMVTSMFW